MLSRIVTCLAQARRGRSVVSAILWAALSLPVAVQAQQNDGEIKSTTPFTAIGGSAPRSVASRAADTFNPREYGAVGDGALHPVSVRIPGIRTLAALAAYTVNGTTPYSFIASYPFGNLFNLPAAAISAQGSSTLTFGTSQLTGSAATASSSYALTLADVGGISRGMIATAAGIPANTQVEWVNPATLQIGLSAATTASIASGTSISFVQFWLSHVTLGMRVCGPGVPSGTATTACGPGSPTVTAISSPSVTISAALNAPTVAPTSNTASTPAYEGTPVTFYAPFTDAQVVTLQMDGLGIQAAVQAAEAAGGGRVVLPTGGPGGSYEIDDGIVLPVGQSFGVELDGDGTFGTRLNVISDLGPGRSAVSCGDPTGMLLNARGMFIGGGVPCFGAVHKVTIQSSAVIPFVGARPQLAGVPVAMDGVKQGPRLNMRDVWVQGFDMGIQFAGDWTTDEYVTSTGNFAGKRLANPMPNLFGDLRFEQDFYGGNSWAGFTVAPGAALLSSHVNKSWLSDEPYAFWLEGGFPTIAYAAASIFSTDFTNVTFEGLGCGAIVDGNVKADGTGKVRGLQTVVVHNSVMAANQVNYVPASGCPWNSYIDVGYTYDVSITAPPTNGYAPVTGGRSLIRTDSLDLNGVHGHGGVHLSGGALPSIFDLYAALGQEIISSGTDDGTLFGNRTTLDADWEFPGGRGRFYFLSPTETSTLNKGAVLEAQGYFNGLIAQLAGTATANTAPILGTAYSTYPASMANRLIPVMTDGQAMPVAVSAAQSVPTLLQLDAGNVGKATSASTITTGRPLGYVTDYNGGSASQVFMQAAFGRGGN